MGLRNDFAIMAEEWRIGVKLCRKFCTFNAGLWISNGIGLSRTLLKSG